MGWGKVVWINGNLMEGACGSLVQSDVYSLGMVVLEMCTGEPPYSECKNAMLICRRVSQVCAHYRQLARVKVQTVNRTGTTGKSRLTSPLQFQSRDPN